VYTGSADLEMILREERTEKYIKKMQEEIEEQKEILIISEIFYFTIFLIC
jgi:hypothetical protein